jgi:hypothetical protein
LRYESRSDCSHFREIGRYAFTASRLLAELWRDVTVCHSAAFNVMLRNSCALFEVLGYGGYHTLVYCEGACVVVGNAETDLLPELSPKTTLLHAI